MEFGLHNKKEKRKRRRRRNKKEREIIKSQLHHIPQEIVDNILSKLPGKSLMRFKSVCKNWRSTISDPNFHKRESQSVFTMVKSFETLFLCSIDEKADGEAFPVPWDKKHLGSYDQIHVSNSCNGMVLICLDISLFLFNPLTRYFVKVLSLDILVYTDYGFCMGLCYDESISDYKAVILVGESIVVVASLKGKEWATIWFPFNSMYVRKGPVVEGRFHLVVSDLNGGSYFGAGNKIIRFNPVLNVFEELPSPMQKSWDENAIIGLGVLEGCLCMAHKDNKNDLKGDIEIMAMKEYGVGESWTTMFILKNLEVDRYHGGLTPLLITRDGEVLLSKSNEILAYNLSKKSYRKYDLPNCGNLIYAVSLVENVDSPVGYYWDRMEHYLYRFYSFNFWYGA